MKCLVVVAALAILLGCSGEDQDVKPNNQPDAIRISSGGQLKEVRIELRWEDQWSDAMGLVEISPNFQEHSRHLLIFDHENEVVQDSFANFIGENVSALTESEKTRDRIAYQSLLTAIDGKDVLCPYFAEDCVGPAIRSIEFLLADSESYTGAYSPQQGCGRSGWRYRLCNEELFQILQELRRDR